jgi:hypothetical protein
MYPAAANPATVCSALVGTVKLVFVTKGTYNGDLGGVAGANAICQAEAGAYGYPGAYKAWISDSLGNQPSLTFTQSAVPYVNTNATAATVATNWSKLLTSGPSNIAGINGNPFPSGVFWDCTNADGTPCPYASSYDCVGWTSTSGQGDVGNSGTLPGQDNVPACTNKYPLTCFQQ